MTILSNLVVVSILWLFTSIPLITVGASSSALYYSVVKVIRNDTGSLTKEYFRAFKMNFIQCIVPGLLFILYSLVMIMDFYNSSTGNGYYSLPRFVWILIISFFIMLSGYLFPVISRFKNNLPALLRLSMSMMMKHLKVSFQLFLLVFAAVVVGWIFLPCVIVLPGLLGYLTSYLLEPVLEANY